MKIQEPPPPIHTLRLSFATGRRTPAPSLAMALVIIFLNVQLRLLVQVVEGAWRGQAAMALSATVLSSLCCLGAWRLWRTLLRGETKLS